MCMLLFGARNPSRCRHPSTTAVRKLGLPEGRRLTCGHTATECPDLGLTIADHGASDSSRCLQTLAPPPRSVGDALDNLPQRWQPRGLETHSPPSVTAALSTCVSPIGTCVTPLGTERPQTVPTQPASGLPFSSELVLISVAGFFQLHLIFCRKLWFH